MGVSFVIAPWNYPYLTSVNSIIPSLAAGNSVILKHSAQTPLCAEQLYESAKKTLPKNIFNYLHMDHKDSLKVVSDKRTAFVSFTGSVKAGYEVQKATNNKFISIALELGGKDPAYVRHDADIEKTVENLVDGSFFNSGQSCCGVERIYVHEHCYDDFLNLLVSETKKLKVGDPRDKDTYLGPMAKQSGLQHVLGQVDLAMKNGAKPLIEAENISLHVKEQYLRPEVFVNVNHEMDLMKEETFGPVVGVMKVSSDEEALKLMNDSQYGLTASLWTKDKERAIHLGQQIETGTVMMNRCDYVDPELAWTGVKETGIGFALSELAINVFTKPKSFLLMK